MSARIARYLVAAVLGCVVSGTAVAGPYADEMAKCLVSRTDAADRTRLVQWMFAGFSAHPDVRALAEVSAAQRDKLNAEVAGLFMRLLTESCREQTVAAMTYEGNATIESSFEVLGAVAARELMAHPDVATFLGGLESHMDSAKLEAALGGAAEDN